MTRTQFMLRYTISNPSMHTTIVGTASMEHLADNLRTAELGPPAAGRVRGGAAASVHGDSIVVTVSRKGTLVAETGIWIATGAMGKKARLANCRRIHPRAES